MTDCSETVRTAVERIDDLVEFIRMECAKSEAATELMRSALEVRNDLSLMLNGVAPTSPPRAAR